MPIIDGDVRDELLNSGVVVMVLQELLRQGGIVFQVQTKGQ